MNLEFDAQWGAFPAWGFCLIFGALMGVIILLTTENRRPPKYYLVDLFFFFFFFFTLSSC